MNSFDKRSEDRIATKRWLNRPVEDLNLLFHGEPEARARSGSFPRAEVRDTRLRFSIAIKR